MTLAGNLDKGIWDGYVPVKCADRLTLRGIVYIMDETIKVQSILDHLKQCMEPQKIKFNEGENFNLKDQTSVRREILLSKNSNENELVI